LRMSRSRSSSAWVGFFTVGASIVKVGSAILREDGEPRGSRGRTPAGAAGP